jgi:enamine deaminase RidA (YjgF/YER057c/UK114 family)
MRVATLLLVVITHGSVALSGQTLERINPPGLGKPASYSHIVKAGKTIYIAGQIGAKADGTLAGATMAAQLEQVLANLQTALSSQGANFSHVAKVTIFVTSIAEFRAPDAVKVREKYFGTNRPASTLVQIQQLANADYKVEIEAVAVLP